jgi:hypothetical protein
MWEWEAALIEGLTYVGAIFLFEYAFEYAFRLGFVGVHLGFVGVAIGAFTAWWLIERRDRKAREREKERWRGRTLL